MEKVIGRYFGIRFGFVDKPKIKEFPYGFVIVIPYESQYSVFNLDKNTELIVVDGGRYCFKVRRGRPTALDVIEPVACP
jgi:hypothetical protein